MKLAREINTNILKVLVQIKENAGLKEQADYIKSKLAVVKKEN